MKLAQQNSWSKLLEATAEERTWLDEYTSVETTRYRPGHWGKIKVDDRVRMFNAASRSLPSGFVSLLKNAAKRDRVTFEVEDQRVRPCSVDLDADLAWLRDYQQGAVTAALRSGRGLVKVPTGGGKTEIAIGVVKSLPCEHLFLVHRADLVSQAGDRFHLRTGETAGTWEGAWMQGTANFTVATFQGLYKAMKEGNSEFNRLMLATGALHIDESHAVPAASFYQVTMAAVNAYYRFGYSGTPLDRGDEDSLRAIGALGPVVYTMPTETLVSAGVLEKPTIYMLPCTQAWSKNEHAEWHGVYSKLVALSKPRNELLAEMAVRSAKPALCFVDQLDQGLDLQNRMRARGLKVDFVHGSHWLEARKRAIRHLVQGRTDVLLCSVIFQEGIDIPQLASVLIGTGKESVVATLQRIGRGMRTAKGKSGFEVWDVLDKGQRWLEDHALGRLESYRREGHDVRLIATLEELDAKLAAAASGV